MTLSSLLVESITRWWIFDPSICTPFQTHKAWNDIGVMGVAITPCQTTVGYINTSIGTIVDPEYGTMVGFGVCYSFLCNYNAMYDPEYGAMDDRTCYNRDINPQAMVVIRVVCNDAGNTNTAIDKRFAYYKREGICYKLDLDGIM